MSDERAPARTLRARPEALLVIDDHPIVLQGVRVPASVTVTGPATPHAVGTFSPVALSWPSSPGQTVL